MCEEAQKEPENQWNHSRFMWKLRCHPFVKWVFSEVWKCRPEELLTSFDGIYHRPPHGSFVLPWHMDHDLSVSHDKMTSVQGVLALSNIDETTGGTQLLPGSHLRCRAVCERNRLDDESDGDDDDWTYTEVDPTDRIFSMGLTPIQPKLAAGDLLLWDSRLLHRVVAQTDPSTCRWTAYLSMVPRSIVSDDVLEQRRTGFLKGVSTTHWVQTFVDRGETRRIPDQTLLHTPKVWNMVC